MAKKVAKKKPVKKTTKKAAPAPETIFVIVEGKFEYDDEGGYDKKDSVQINGYKKREKAEEVCAAKNIKWLRENNVRSYAYNLKYDDKGKTFYNLKWTVEDIAKGTIKGNEEDRYSEVIIKLPDNTKFSHVLEVFKAMGMEPYFQVQELEMVD